MPRIESDAELNKSPNVEAILKWVDSRRPDCARTVRQVISDSREYGSQACAIWALMTMAFSAGRTYQNEHKDINPEIFHRL